jgi:hypothetical protein
MRLQVIIHTTRPNVSICWNSCSHVSASSSWSEEKYVIMACKSRLIGAWIML